MSKHGETISLVDDQGNEHEFSIVDVIEVAEQRYAILQPAEGGEEAVIFRVEDDETLTTVDDEEEFDRVAAALRDLEEYDAIEIADDAEAEGAGDGEAEGEDEDPSAGE
ncbi:MAG: DUF1292 domain-containing protein [Armatimonadota bacterium]|nr:DUF1292 domain-containing protein [Armatimonadota bacterium]